MRRLTAIGFILTLVLGFTGHSALAQGQPITLSYASGYGATFSLSMHDVWWAQEVEKRTGGKVKIEFYWSEGLAKISESLDAVNSGLADIAFFATAMFGAKLPLSTATSLLYVTEKPDALSNAMMDMYRTFAPLQEEYEKKNNVKVLSFSGTTPLIFGTREAWKGLDDFKGKKVRTFPGLEGPLASVGATPVTIAWGEIYTSLERGVVDAYTGTMWDLAGIGKFHEKAPYIIDLGVGVYAMAGTHINKDKWNKLPADVRKVLEEVAAEAIKKQPELYMQADERIYQVYKKANVKTVVFSQEDKNKFRNLVVPKQWEKWVSDMEGKGLPGKKFFDTYQSAIKKHEPKSNYVSPFARFTDLAQK
jgi:TRAP-type C4-dicarboxylate transport system substrate-binding protein